MKRSKGRGGRAGGEDEVLSRVSAERRDFLRQVIAGAAFASPAVTLFQLGCGPDPELDARPQSGTYGQMAANTQVVIANADTTLRSDAPDANEGANPYLRVAGMPAHRALVAFPSAEIQAAARQGIVRARLVLTIANNHNDWGTAEAATVDAHPLTTEFTEGNGAGLGLPRDQGTVGSGPGATWASPSDLDIAMQGAQGDLKWGGGDYGPASAASAVHDNQQVGPVTWDVTADVLAGVTGWLVRATAESASPAAPAGGTVEYFSRESGGEVLERRPQLILDLQPPAGTGTLPP